MGARMNFVVSVVALVIAIVGCLLAVRLTLQPAPLSAEKVSAIVEERTRTLVTEEKVKEIVEGAVATLKPTAP